MCSLPFLDVLGEDFIVVGSKFLGLLEALNLALLCKSLSSESLLGNESLDLGALVESLVFLLDLATNNILSHIVLLSEGEDLADVACSLGAEFAWLVVSGNTLDVSITLLHNLEGNNSQIGAANASANGLSLSLTSSSGSVGCGL